MADLILEREDADRITNCYQNPRSIHTLHLYHYSYFYRPEIYDPIFEVNFPDELDEIFVKFVNDFLHQPLKDMILNSTWSDALDFCTRLLLQHNCHIEDSCKNHLLLIMKLRTLGINKISLVSIIRDFHVLRKYKSDIHLLALYYENFIDVCGLEIVFFTKFPLEILQYFLETILVGYDVPNFNDFSHRFLTDRDFKRLELFITFGVRNLESFEEYFNYYDMNYSHEFDHRGVVYLYINTRIKMRIMQIFILFKAQNAILMQKIVATNQEPYLTKQQYEAAFYEILPDESRMYFATVIEKRWNWYKKVFQIEDDTPVMPRKLQDICRLSIRDILARRGQLPSGVDSITKSAILRRYLKLEDLIEYSVD